MRFLADMGISPAILVELRAKGHDASHLRDEGLERLPDSAIIEKARSEERILLTCDLDFGYLMAVSGESLPTVILFRLSDMRPPNVLAHLHRTIDQEEDQLAAGAIVAVTDRRIRVRRLPIGAESE